MPKFAVDSHRGRVRTLNEDSYEAAPDIGLWLVADGVGGHESGDVASELTRSTIASCYRSAGGLVTAIEAAHHAVRSAIANKEGGADMASTVVALAMQGGDFQIAWLGDSRAYLWNGALRLLTRDHSLVEELVSSGEISREESEKHPNRHVITRCVGMSSESPVQVASLSGSLADGESLLLCSDGLNDAVDSATISHIMATVTSAEERVTELIAAALQGGGRDNVTVAVIDSGASNITGRRLGALSNAKSDSVWQRFLNLFR